MPPSNILVRVLSSALARSHSGAKSSIQPFLHLISGLILIGLLINCGGSSKPNNPQDPQNSLPQANAGADRSVVSGNRVTLDGSASTDEEGALRSYQWQQTGGDAIALDSATSASASFVAPTVTAPSTLTFTLTVTDSDGATDTDSVVVTVQPTVTTPFGLDERPSNTTCLAGDAPPNAAGVQLTRVFAQLTGLTQVLALKQAPNDNSRWFAVEKRGRIVSFANQANVSQTNVFLDIRTSVNSSANESGLLAMAFHPNFASNGFVYLFYQSTGTPRQSVLARFQSTDGGLTLTPTSKLEMLRFTTPYDNHFGGEIEFGPDGHLYLSIGDGGSGGDPGNRAQNNKTLFGKLIRIAVSATTAGAPYTIPTDNPFVGGALCNTATIISPTNQNCPEIYALGLRNAWRFSFDKPTGDLWLGDVGQDKYEEIDLIQKGGNYGWRIREGFHCFNPSNCSPTGLIDPVAEIPHPDGESVTGGVVYRGNRIPLLKGKYIFGDYASGTIWGLFEDDNGDLQPRELINSSLNIAHFTQDAAGDVYIVNFANSQFFRLDPSAAQTNPTPTKLSLTGCVQVNDPTKPAPGLIPYSVNAPFWSDDANKGRYFALPDNTQIHIDNEGRWQFPLGSVLLKHFYHQDKLIETRLMKLHNNSAWAGYTYAWNAEQTEADLVFGGATGAFNLAQWIYPSSAQCLRCHTEVGGRTLGLTTAQLNKSHLYSTTGRNANQLETYQHIGILDGVPEIETMVDPNNTAASLNDRARAYLDVNCSQCHQPNGPTNSDMDLRYTASLTNAKICNTAPQNGNLGFTNPMLLAPGNADNSLIYIRLNSRDPLRAMPPIGSFKVDAGGAKLIKDWINGLSGC
jgi:uncharacterized repeat protein (TIGR03806 family)